MASTEQTMWNFYRSKGLSEDATAAILGNAYRESGYDSSASSTAWGTLGLFQWRLERNSALKSYAESVNKSPTDLQTQLEYSWKELTGKYSKTLTYLQDDSHSLSQMTQYFNTSFEKSGDNGKKRISFAQQILNRMKGTTVDVNTTTTTEGSQGIIAGAVTNLSKGALLIVMGILGAIFFLHAFDAVPMVKSIPTKLKGE